MAMSLQSTAETKLARGVPETGILVEGIAPCNEACLVAQDVERMIRYVTEENSKAMHNSRRILCPRCWAGSILILAKVVQSGVR
jgi:hypothetical protein